MASRFAVPEPLETVFVSWYQGGEVLRSGMTWRRGAGNVFYFSPGHETYPIYHQPEIGRSSGTPVRWAQNPAPAWKDIAEAPNVPVERAPERSRAAASASMRTARRGCGEAGAPSAAGNRQHGSPPCGEFAALPGCEVVAAVELVPERLEAFLATHKIPRGFLRLEEAIAWGEFDAAANITPDAVHFATTMQLIAAGKHVFCEKPLAPTHAEALEMTEAIERAGLINMVNLRYRGLPVMQKARELVAAGEIGAVRHIDAAFPAELAGRAALGRLADRGALAVAAVARAWLRRACSATSGIHILDFACFVSGQNASSVHCRLKSFAKAEGDRIGAYGLDANDSFVMSIEFDGGALGVVHASRWTTGYAKRPEGRRLRHQRRAGDFLRKRGIVLRACLGEDVHTQTWREVECPPVPLTYETLFRRCARGGAPNRASVMRPNCSMCWTCASRATRRTNPSRVGVL
jgi:predicted dehydrogenase